MSWPSIGSRTRGRRILQALGTVEPCNVLQCRHCEVACFPRPPPAHRELAAAPPVRQTTTTSRLHRYFAGPTAELCNVYVLPILIQRAPCYLKKDTVGFPFVFCFLSFGKGVVSYGWPIPVGVLFQGTTGANTLDNHMEACI
jgi:hypothetical protein